MKRIDGHDLCLRERRNYIYIEVNTGGKTYQSFKNLYECEHADEQSIGHVIGKAFSYMRETLKTASEMYKK